MGFILYKMLSRFCNKTKAVLVVLPFQEAWAYFQLFMIDKILQLTLMSIFPFQCYLVVVSSGYYFSACLN